MKKNTNQETNKENHVTVYYQNPETGTIVNDYFMKTVQKVTGKSCEDYVNEKILTQIDPPEIEQIIKNGALKRSMAISRYIDLNECSYKEASIAINEMMAAIYPKKAKTKTSTEDKVSEKE